MTGTLAARLTLCAAFCAVLAAPIDATAQRRFEQARAAEQAVREMPMSQRPNRIGHFYGNTVRRVQQGTFFVNRGKHARPVARYFYVPR